MDIESNERISSMDAILFALALEVSFLQIRILGNPAEVLAQASKNKSTTELRAQCWDVTNHNDKLRCEKLSEDRNTVKDVIRRTLVEVAENGEFPTLQDAVAVLIQRASSAVSKRMQYDQLIKSRKEIVEELETKRIQWAEQLRNADHKTAAIRDQINDNQLNANLRLAYAEKWVVARSEALELQYQRPRATPPDTDHEQRVHEELLKAYEMQIQEREKSLRNWEERYEIDIADIKARLAAKREQLRVATLRHEELQKLHDLHEGEMRAWLTFKSERAARWAREERLRMSATRIQAWWRGTMVRRGLGAFRFMRNVKKSSSKKKK